MGQSGEAGVSTASQTTWSYQILCLRGPDPSPDGWIARVATDKIPRFLIPVESIDPHGSAYEASV